MSLAFNTLAANTLLGFYSTNYPATATVTLYTGSPPGPNNAATGTTLVTITLPATPWNAASAGSITKNGTWSNTATAAGTAGYFRLANAAGTILEEGTCTATGGGGDMTLDNTNIASGQTVTISTYTRTRS